VTSAIDFASDVGAGDVQSAVGSGTAFVAGALETASFAAPLVGAGLTGLPPVAAVVGAFSLGWSVGTPVGKFLDQQVQPGSGATGDWYYRAFLR
jgi:hypothetical protein